MNNTADERGQALPLVVIVIVLAGVLALALGRISSAAIDRARARTAADAAALAGAAEGEAAARDVASANAGEVVSYRTLGADVAVLVRVGDAHARARARREGAVGSESSWRANGIRAGLPAARQGSGGDASPLRRAPP